MTSATYTIFKPYEGPFKIKRNFLAIVVFSICILGYFLPIEFGESFINIFFITVFIFYLCLFATRWTYKSLYGKLEGEIIFKLDEIIIEGQHFYLKDLQEIEIYPVDYYGQQVEPTNGGFARVFSQGVKNYVQLTNNLGQTYLYYFRFQDQHDYKKLEEVIDEYYKLKKISFDRKYELEKTDLFAN